MTCSTTKIEKKLQLYSPFQLLFGRMAALLLHECSFFLLKIISHGFITESA
jgi:hypothetical protein